jgi:hypothetical protein
LAGSPFLPDAGAEVLFIRTGILASRKSLVEKIIGIEPMATLVAFSHFD